MIGLPSVEINVKYEKCHVRSNIQGDIKEKKKRNTCVETELTDDVNINDE